MVWPNRPQLVFCSPVSAVTGSMLNRIRITSAMKEESSIHTISPVYSTTNSA